MVKAWQYAMKWRAAVTPNLQVAPKRQQAQQTAEHPQASAKSFRK
jgi:hypothetical protein